MNYAQLVDAIKSTAEDYGDNFADSIPRFVKQAEQRIYNTAQLPAVRKSATPSTVNNNIFLQMPADYLSVFELAVVLPSGERKFLLNKDVSFIREVYPNPTATGIPTHYAVANATQLLLGPTPDASYTTELNYYGYPESIVTAGSTWLGDNFDTTLLWGALYEAALFNKSEEDIVKYYKDQFDSAMALLKQHVEGKNTQDDYRTGHVRFGVK